MRIICIHLIVHVIHQKVSIDVGDVIIASEILF